MPTRIDHGVIVTRLLEEIEDGIIYGVRPLQQKIAEQTGYPPERIRIVLQGVALAHPNIRCMYNRGGTVARVQWRTDKRYDADTARQRSRERREQQEARERQHTTANNARVTELEAEVAALKKNSCVLEVQLKQGDKTVKKIKGLFHEKFATLVDLAKARMNIFLYGPTGCGKSHVCAQLAEALGLSFSFVSCTAGMSEGVLGGRLLPTGEQGTFEYVISEFIQCYENGGVFLLDEIDAADPNVLLLVNAALANGKVAVPNRPDNPYAKRHPDFICVAAANTVGTGADRQYSGRNKLDAATLDRFQIGKVQMSYDERVEEQLCPDKDLLNVCHSIRHSINEHRLERAMSTRFIKDAYTMKTDLGWSHKQILDAFFSGWREDEIRKVRV